MAPKQRDGRTTVPRHQNMCVLVCRTWMAYPNSRYFKTSYNLYPFEQHRSLFLTILLTTATRSTSTTDLNYRVYFTTTTTRYGFFLSFRNKPWELSSVSSFKKFLRQLANSLVKTLRESSHRFSTSGDMEKHACSCPALMSMLSQEDGCVMRQAEAATHAKIADYYFTHLYSLGA